MLHPPDRPLPLIDSIIPWNYLYFTVWMRYFVHAGEWIVSVLRICCSSRKMSWAAGWLKIMRARHRQNGWWGEEEEEGCGTVKFSGQTKRNISLLFCFIADIQPAGCYAFLTPNGRTHAGPPIICLSIYIYVYTYTYYFFFFPPLRKMQGNHVLRHERCSFVHQLWRKQMMTTRCNFILSVHAQTVLEKGRQRNFRLCCNSIFYSIQVFNPIRTRCELLIWCKMRTGAL